MFADINIVAYFSRASIVNIFYFLDEPIAVRHRAHRPVFSDTWRLHGQPSTGAGERDRRLFGRRPQDRPKAGAGRKVRDRK